MKLRGDYHKQALNVFNKNDICKVKTVRELVCIRWFTKMILYHVVSLVLCSVLVVYGVLYHSFEGVPMSNETYLQFVKNNSSRWCVNNITLCDPFEWRRVDGSCNNLREPTRGATHTPFYRLLPPALVYNGKDYETIRSKSGKPLPLVRKIRKHLLAESHIPDPIFTQLSTYFLVFAASDVTNLHDTVNYVLWTSDCCNKGKHNDMCAPIEVPADDSTHRFTDIRCFNLTKPLTFQTQGCLKKGFIPERIMSATPLFDLSTVYGNEGFPNARESRTYKGGALLSEIDENNITWPPSTKSRRHICILNQLPYETRCHSTPSDEVNTLLPINIVSIWFWRLHNYIASGLARVNPHWDDEKLFHTARDINIAIENQILYYELMQMLMGHENLVRDGVITRDLGFRDIYDSSFIPQISMEYPMALRWLHNMVDATMKMYNADGTLIKKVSTVDLITRTGYLAVDNNIAYITQGSFRQASGKLDDHVTDPDISERVLGDNFQRAQDVNSNDLAKDRLMFLQPYTKYLKYCFGKHVQEFEDLKDYFEPEVLEKLAELYEDVEDIDFLAGMWTENYVNGGRVPYTFYCVVVQQMIHTVKSDRHWYEKPNRPHAFTIKQLLEIRKTSIASVLCAIGDSVTHIQPSAFQRIAPGNDLTSCRNIPQVDLTAWRE